MDNEDAYRLTIDTWSPETIPMERLAAYMAEFARVLGETTAVHFGGIEKGSTRLVAKVDRTAEPKVAARMLRVRSGEGPDDARKALASIDTMMVADNAVGAVLGPDNVVYANFTGRDRPKPATFGPFRERHSIDGVVVRIGGIDNTVPVWLQDGDAPPQICETSVELSKGLAEQYRRGVIRAHGLGTWVRGGDGSWTMLKFRIEGFEPLDDAPIEDVVTRLRAVGGSRWHEAADPIEEARRLRHGEGG